MCCCEKQHANINEGKSPSAEISVLSPNSRRYCQKVMKPSVEAYHRLLTFCVKILQHIL